VKDPLPADRVDAVVGRWQADGAPFDAATVALFTRLHLLVHAVVEHKERAVAELGVPPHVVATVYALRRRGRPYEAGPTDLARELGVTQAAMTARVRVLTGQGLVATRPHPDDGRRVLIRLTADGHRLTEQVFRLQAETEESFLADLSATERATLDRLVRTVFAALPDDPRITAGRATGHGGMAG